MKRAVRLAGDDRQIYLVAPALAPVDEELKSPLSPARSIDKALPPRFHLVSYRDFPGFFNTAVRVYVFESDDPGKGGDDG